ncbi:hypothetical protein Tco_0781278 [Tanacetum coccineum]
MVRASSTKVRFRISTTPFYCGVRANDVWCEIPTSSCTQEFVNKVDELRAISCHMLGTSEVQIPKNNFDNLKLTGEEDGTSEALDPQD